MDYEDPEIWVKQFTKQAEEMSQRAEAMQQKMANLQGEASNEFCSLVINAGGALENLRFTSKYRTTSAEYLAEAVMDAYAVALTTINQRTQEMLADLGGDTAAMQEYTANAVEPHMRERAERVRKQQEGNR